MPLSPQQRRAAGARARSRSAAAIVLAALVLGACVDPSEVVGSGFVTPLAIKDWRDEVIYQLLVDRFADGDVNNNTNVVLGADGRYHGGDWQGLIDRLDYIEALGVTALWISPVVKNVEESAGFYSYHGYWTQHFTRVNPHFGDLAKLRQLVDACHRRGIKVILDVVTNHIGPLFYYDINGNGRPDEFLIGAGGAPGGLDNLDYPGQLTRTNEWDPDYDSRGVRGFTSLGEFGPAPIRWVYQPADNKVAPGPAGFERTDWYNRRGRVTVWRHEYEACQQISGLVDPGDWYANDDCRTYIRGQELKGDFPGGLKDLDTTRQDVRDALFGAFAHWIEVAGFDGFRIDTLKHVEHEFLRDFAPRIRQRAAQLGKKNFLVFGEVFDGREELLASYVGDDQVDSVFYFSQKFNVFDDVFKRKQPTRNIETLIDRRLGPAALYPDQPNAGGPVDEQGKPVSPRRLMVNFLDNHDVARFRFEHDDTPTHHNALLFLLTEDGIPCLYYGTEQRFKGGNDPANREDLWPTGFDTDNGTFRYIKTLIALRKELAPLRRGDLRVVWSSETPGDGASEDAGIFAFERSLEGKTVLVLLNTSDEKTSRPANNGVTLKTSFAPGTALVNLLCTEGPGGDYGAHRCSAQEQSQPAITVGADGTLAGAIDIAPRAGLILLPKGEGG